MYRLAAQHSTSGWVPTVWCCELLVCWLNGNSGGCRFLHLGWKLQVTPSCKTHASVLGEWLGWAIAPVGACCCNPTRHQRQFLAANTRPIPSTPHLACIVIRKGRRQVHHISTRHGPKGLPEGQGSPLAQGARMHCICPCCCTAACTIHCTPTRATAAGDAAGAGAVCV